MVYQVSAGLSVASLLVCLTVPLYCLAITPSDALTAYSELYNVLGTVTPSAQQMSGSIPKIVYLLLWLICVSGQLAATLALKPRWWVAAGQAVVAGGIVALFGIWHLALVHLPMIKLFNDLS